MEGKKIETRYKRAYVSSSYVHFSPFPFAISRNFH